MRKTYNILHNDFLNTTNVLETSKIFSYFIKDSFNGSHEFEIFKKYLKSHKLSFKYYSINFLNNYDKLIILLLLGMRKNFSLKELIYADFEFEDIEYFFVSKYLYLNKIFESTLNYFYFLDKYIQFTNN